MSGAAGVVVVGAGRAGRAAALGAARAGRDVLLLDEGDVAAVPGVHVRAKRLVWMVGEDNRVEVVGPEGRETYQAGEVVWATGRELGMLPFRGWGLRGVGGFGGRVVGRRIVVAGEGPGLARELRRLGGRLGGRVAAVADLGRGWVVAGAFGDGRVERVKLVRARRGGTRSEGRAVFVRSDGVAMGYERIPAALVAGLGEDVEICPCEGLSRGALDEAIAEGAHDMNRLRSFTRCGMGVCQGRLCGAAAAALVRARTGREPGGWTPRPPLRPVRLGALLGTFTYADIPVPPAAPL